MDHRLSLLPLLLAASFAAAQEEPKQPPATGDALMAQAKAISPDFVKAVTRARVHNKRLFVLFPDVGHDLAADLKKDRVLSRKLLYEVELVTLSGESATKMADCWLGKDERPAAVLLGDGGSVLARLGMGDLIADGKIAGASVLAKIEPQFCAPVDAQKKLDDAVVLAKKTGRHVFVRFDAPW